jgi:hypothetical protein
VTRLSIAAAALLLALPATAAAAPALQVRGLAPLTLRGLHFVAAERVQVTFGGTHVTAHATPQGTFLAKFAGVTVDRCDGYLVTAVGSAGSRAEARARPLACASTSMG